VQNVFALEVVKTSSYVITPEVRGELARRGLDSRLLAQLDGKKIIGSAQFRQTLQRIQPWSEKQMVILFDCADVDTLVVDTVQAFTQREPLPLSPQQHRSLATLHGATFEHRWKLDRALAQADSSWLEYAGMQPRKQITALRQLRSRVYEIFRIHP